MALGHIYGDDDIIAVSGGHGNGGRKVDVVLAVLLRWW